MLQILYLVSLAVILFLSIARGATAGPGPAATVWYSPVGESPDFLRLFTNPEQWTNARKRINVFKFTPSELQPTTAGAGGRLADLKRVRAFQRLQQWNIEVAVEAPSVKEWDCSAHGDTADPRVRGNAEAATLNLIRNVHDAGGSVRYLAMDEPLSSGLTRCKDRMEKVAESTADYVKSLLADQNVRAWAPALSIGDIEAYPSRSLADLEAWITLLVKAGYKPDFFHLDVDMNDVRARAGALNAPGDFRSLKIFLRDRGITFGIIFWSGHDPEASDQSYFNDTLSWVGLVKAAMGRPEQSIFQSWVRRSSNGCTPDVGCTKSDHLACGPQDPPYCNARSVPINLPDDNANIFSHTRLLDKIMTILDK